MVQRLGDYTDQVAQVPVGTKVKLEGPFGRFDQEVQQTTGPVVLYGLGSGVAPLLSLSQRYQTTKTIHLVWTGPHVDDEYYQHQIEQLRQRGVTVTAQEHRLSTNDLAQLFTEKEIHQGIVIVVGAASKVIQVERVLRHLGWHRLQIKDERITM